MITALLRERGEREGENNVIGLIANSLNHKSCFELVKNEMQWQILFTQ